MIQAWAPVDGAHFLLEQWRGQASYREFRAEAWRYIRRYRPSVLLIEATGQGPALASDIRPQSGVDVRMISPVDNKVERLRRHRRIISRGSICLPEGAPWCADFLDEAVLFPNAAFDDQVDALSQYLDHIVVHPKSSEASRTSVDCWGQFTRPSLTSADRGEHGGAGHGHDAQILAIISSPGIRSLQADPVARCSSV